MRRSGIAGRSGHCRAVPERELDRPSRDRRVALLIALRARVEASPKGLNQAAIFFRRDCAALQSASSIASRILPNT
jgi:hypothetical protein